MKTLRTLGTVCLLMGFIAPNSLQAQFFENFDQDLKPSYAGASVALSTGSWFLDDALIGNLDNDKRNGTYSVRMDRRNDRMGNIFMEFDKPNGADEISFVFANYGNAEGNTLQVQYSINQGATWINIGDELNATSTLQEVTIPVEVEGNIRFKFVQVAGTERLNLDDVRITDFVEAQDTATILVSVDDAPVSPEDLVVFSPTLVQTQREKTISIRNLGSTVLEISDLNVVGSSFSVSELADSTLDFNQTVDVTLTFAPMQAGNVQGTLAISSNADNVDTFNLNLGGEAFEDGDIIPISEVYNLPFGTRVSVTGRVTAGNEFGGPMHLQDETGGLAVFWEPLHSTAQIGDSVVVTGPITEFNPIDGPAGDFLLQIGAVDGDNNISFELFTDNRREVEPALINIQQMNSGAFEGQLVRMQEVIIDHAGAFQGNINYDMSDASGQAFLRIDNTTNVVGATAPVGSTNIIGIVGQFNGDYQLLPRFTQDLGVEEVSFPFDEIPKDDTFDIVTWNIEWFGSTASTQGPEDVEQQKENVKTVLTTIDADVYALQEITNSTLFHQMMDELDEYRGFIAPIGQSQKTAYVYKTSSVDSVSAQLITAGMTQSDWANGRFPFEFVIRAQGLQEPIYLYNIHAKAFGEESDYLQRVNASAELKNFIDSNRGTDQVIVLGDYNDLVTSTTADGETDSPYRNFVSDTEYTILTQSLEERGFTSFSRFTMIDHIMISSELDPEYLEGTERVENPFYVGSFLSEASDHFPVWVRFDLFALINSTEEKLTPNSFTLDQNFPNPFNPTTTIRYSVPVAGTVSLKVYNLVGQEVATLVQGFETAGAKEIRFDASDLASGLYIYRLNTPSGSSITRKMMLIK
ncbi:MAG: DUF5689 domain-containing protein [Bacteroidota bacterium]